MNGIVELTKNNNTPPKNDDNPARAQLCNLFFRGKKQHFRYKLLFRLTQNEQSTPLNFAKRLILEFQPTPPSYNLLSGPNSDAHPALQRKAEKCSIRLSDVKVTCAGFELGEQQMRQYVSQFTDGNPDTYRFTRHAIQNYSHQTGPQQYDMEITKDVLPDKIAVCLKHKTYNTGSITINPHIMYKLPNGGKTQFLLHSSSMYDTMLDASKPREIYKRLGEFNAKKQPMSG